MVGHTRRMSGPGHMIISSVHSRNSLRVHFSRNPGHRNACIPWGSRRRGHPRTWGISTRRAGKLSRARLRLYRSRFLHPDTPFSAFFENYKIFRLFHRSNLQKLVKHVCKLCLFFVNKLQPGGSRRRTEAWTTNDVAIWFCISVHNLRVLIFDVCQTY